MVFVYWHLLIELCSIYHRLLFFQLHIHLNLPPIQSRHGVGISDVHQTTPFVRGDPVERQKDQCSCLPSLDLRGREEQLEVLLWPVTHDKSVIQGALDMDEVTAFLSWPQLATFDSAGRVENSKRKQK